MSHYSVEVARKHNSHMTRIEVHEAILNAMMRSNIASLSVAAEEGYVISLEDLEHVTPGIIMNVEHVTVYLERTSSAIQINSECSDLLGNADSIVNGVNGHKDSFTIYVYELDQNGEEAEYMDDNDEDEGQSAASHHWILPSRSFHGLWDSLIFESSIKRKLVDYVKTAIMFSSRGVNSTLVSWNKVILLHGPPGTGKTSLCKALAQKALIRLQDDFLYGQLVEINSHSLFSKWFSESGKLVTKMFDKILEMVEDPKGLVFLLVDEVESLAQCRQSAESGNEPTDSIRAVNALLTQIDRIKKYPNVIILTTSNMVGSIDIAFVDRADLKIYIGHPPTTVIYGILASCINELLRVNLLKSVDDFIFPPILTEENSKSTYVSSLTQISERAKGFSGRTLRKLSFLTFANSYSETGQSESCDLSKFLEAMFAVVEKELMDRVAVNNKNTSS